MIQELLSRLSMFFLFLPVLLVICVLEARLQENLVDEDVRVRGGEGCAVREGAPCARIVLCPDERDGEGRVNSQHSSVRGGWRRAGA